MKIWKSQSDRRRIVQIQKEIQSKIISFKETQFRKSTTTNLTISSNSQIIWSNLRIISKEPIDENDSTDEEDLIQQTQNNLKKQTNGEKNIYYSIFLI